MPHRRIRALAGVAGLAVALAGTALPAAGQTSASGQAPPPSTTCVLVILCTVASTPPGDTTTTVPAPTEAASSAFRLEEGSPAEARLLALIGSSRAQHQALEAQIRGLTATVSTLEKELRAAEGRLKVAERQAGQRQQDLDDRSRELERAEAELRRLAIAAYVHGSAAVNRVADLIVNNRPTGAVEMAAGYARAAADIRVRAVRHLRTSRAELQGLRPQLDTASKAASAERDAVASKTAAVAASRRSLSELSSKLAGQIAAEETLVGQVFASQDEFEARFRSLSEESDAITTLLRARGADGPSATPGSRRLGPPVPGGLVTSAFGPRMHPIFGTVRPHNGLDIAAGAGTPVVAAADGTVVAAGYSGGYGNRVVIAHGNSLATLSAHLGNIVVSPNQRVVRGEPIGVVGCSGLCTGPHLHFEVRLDGEPVDAAPWL